MSQLTAIRPIYMLPDEQFVPDVLIPCFENAVNVDCVTGYFSSEALVTLAPGLATFVGHSTGTLRLIVSPFLSAEDRRAMKDGLLSHESAAEQLLKDMLFTEDLIRRHTLRCFAWLLSAGRIEIKIGFVAGALFHSKAWLFYLDSLKGEIAVHGSANMTYPGINTNIEQVSISRSWENANEKYSVDRIADRFDNYWDGKSTDCVVIDLPDAFKEHLLRDYKGDNAPTEDELDELYKRATKLAMVRDENVGARKRRFVVPDHLEFDSGDFEHQGRAVNAWCQAGYRGVLEMATGSGKTNTAMLAAHRLYCDRSPLMIVVAAPYRPLVQQWCAEMKSFGLDPINLGEEGNRSSRARALSRMQRRLRMGQGTVEAIVVTHSMLNNVDFRSQIQDVSCGKLLIADEVHNLGSEGFVSDPPDFFDFRLGLSATPERQYDEEGTAELFGFFGPVVFRFTLREAIGRCLVEYDYYVHRVDLTDNEIAMWLDLTSKIKANGWRGEDDKPSEYLKKLLRDRRAILENAENKVRALDLVMTQEDISNLRYTLIYASDKNPTQLGRVNTLLRNHRILFHQITAEETVNMSKTNEILRSFQDGQLQVLTAKRVLDEGVNIPQVAKAFILASTTVERQWTQRRGRLLRKCEEIGKTHSEIHDFIALPPDLDNLDRDMRPLIRGELRRVQGFASLARNAGRQDGPIEAIKHMVETAFY